jgi:hypothetical protein
VLVYTCEVDEQRVALNKRLPWAGATAA